ncbi:response regulator [Thauera sinica]|uniref:Response regulator n=1 Tax=Thauera sinica TaxID=2665146 RepID=A0ABW1ASP6_9RHOO|nr:response regulator [Thauera sp. K11]ATE61328.1 two-component system response regulator [Thauera sp. K11]
MTNTLASPPILLVEDDPVDLDLTLRAFGGRRCGHPIEVARDGEEALSYIARWDAGERLPLFVLLDIKLPKINGLEVLREFKAHPQYRRIPVVILTSSGEDSDLRSAYDLGANSYIVKPVDFGRFGEAIGQVENYWCALNHGVQK